MKIVITGASGFIGTFLVDQLLLKDNVEIVPLTRDKKSQFYTDYSIYDLCKWLVETDIVIHLAAKRGGTGTFEDYQQNIILSERIAQACKNNNVKKLIFISSISVYSEQKMLPWEENQKVEPKNYYGLSKLVSEEVCRIKLQDSSTKMITLRLAHVYGPNEKNNYMINLFIRKAFNKEVINVTNESGNRREFIYVKDVVRAIILLCEQSIETKYLILNVGSDDLLTNEEVATIISKIFECEQPNIDSRDCEKLKDDSYMNKSKFFGLFQFKTKYNMVEAMKDIRKTMKSGENDVPILF